MSRLGAVKAAIVGYLTAVGAVKGVNRHYLDRLAEKLEPPVFDAVLEQIAKLQGAVQESRVEAALARGDVQAAEDIVLSDKSQQDMKAALGAAILLVLRRSGLATAAVEFPSLSVSVVEPPHAPVAPETALSPQPIGIQWDPASSDLARFASERAEAIVTALADDARSTLKGPNPQAEMGLTDQQAQWARNFEVRLRQLQQGGDWSRITRADWAKMRRAGLSDRQTIEREGLTPEQISGALDAYRTTLIRERAQAIARMETMRATNRAAQELGRQALAQGHVAAVKRRWVVDGDPCPVCAEMEGVTVDIEEPFPGDMEPGAVHPNCRCGTDLVVESA